jgi:hypothetical protein
MRFALTLAAIALFVIAGCGGTGGTGDTGTGGDVPAATDTITDTTGTGG